jgi:hypothetical protein
MTSCAGISRSRYKADEAALLANEMLLSLAGRIGAKDTEGLSDCFLLMDHCLTHFVYLKSILFYIKNGGRSRGSYFILKDQNHSSSDYDLCEFDREIEKDIIESEYRNGNLLLSTVQTRDIPDQDLWYEKVWKEYMEDICADDC